MLREEPDSLWQRMSNIVLIVIKRHPFPARARPVARPGDEKRTATYSRRSGAEIGPRSNGHATSTDRCIGVGASAVVPQYVERFPALGDVDQASARVACTTPGSVRVVT